MEKIVTKRIPAKEALFGDKKFYRSVFAVTTPIIIQNLITNFVSLLDNIMVGRMGTEPMSGVAIVNQLLFVFNLCLFGAVSGAGIFGAQFSGKKDHDGVKYCFRFKLIICFFITAAAFVILIFQGDMLIGRFLHQGDVEGDLEATLLYAKDYLKIMLIGLVPFALNNAYASTLRDTGETFVPMIAGVAAVVTNLLFNWLLIFGKLGFPELGVVGAAIATVISRFVELAIIMIWTHAHKERNPFIVGALRSLAMPRELFLRIFIKMIPLMLNETLWSAGMTELNRCYSVRGISVIAATNITSTISNLFNVLFFSIGSAISIVVGQKLGASEYYEAKKSAYRMITLSVFVCLFCGSLLALFSGLFPRLYNTEEDVRALATTLILITAVMSPMHAFMNAAYFTLRSGGKTFITMLFDSAFLWVVSVPLASFLAEKTTMAIEPLYAIILGVEVIKVVIGLILVIKGVWIHNIVSANGGEADNKVTNE